VRVVSLVPSVTETLLAWRITPVGVTRFCEQPALTSVGGTKDPDLGTIIGLAPDVVVMNDEENRGPDADALTAAGLRLHVVHIESVDDVAPQLDALAAVVGAEPPQPHSLPPPMPDRLRAFVPIWRRPWMTMNAHCYGSSLLARAGVVNVFADSPTRYPETTLDEATSRRPDVVLAPTEPFPFGERHRTELETVAPMTIVDGQDLFWWGARTADALRRLLDAIDLVA
jgi:ABC-type Fe3+-hydroxamate transport system substrate-binding protein